MVQGVGYGSGECQHRARTSCWYGENLVGADSRPIELSVPERLVYSPHVYGHGQQNYMQDSTFPANMPALWDLLWGTIPQRTGVPVVIGEVCAAERDPTRPRRGAGVKSAIPAYSCIQPATIRPTRCFSHHKARSLARVSNVCPLIGAHLLRIFCMRG